MQKVNFVTQTRLQPKYVYSKIMWIVTKVNLQQNSVKYKLDTGWWNSEQNKTANHL